MTISEQDISDLVHEFFTKYQPTIEFYSPKGKVHRFIEWVAGISEPGIIAKISYSGQILAPNLPVAVDRIEQDLLKNYGKKLQQDGIFYCVEGVRLSVTRHPFGNNIGHDIGLAVYIYSDATKEQIKPLVAMLADYRAEMGHTLIQDQGYS